MRAPRMVTSTAMSTPSPPVTHSAAKPLRIRHLLAYGIGDIYGGGAFLLIGMQFLFFLTEIVGLSPLLASVVFGAGKIWDGVSDPLMGYISDRTRSRFGRRRLYFLLGIGPVFLSFLLLWLPVDSTNSLVAFAYYAGVYLLFSTVFTMVMVPYSALNAEMTSDYGMRTRLSGARMMFSQLSALLAGTVPRLIINRYPEGDPTGYFVMGIIFAALYAAPWLLVYLGTWELAPESNASDSASARGGGSRATSPLDIFRQFSSVIKNRSFRIHLGMYICAYSAMDILMALFIYYLTYYIGRPDIYTVAMGVLLLSQLAMLPVYVALSNRFGKGRAYMMGLAIWSLGTLLSLGLGPDTALVPTLVICAVIGMGLSAGVLIPWAMLPSIIDVDELITGRQRAGMYAGVMTLVRKLVQGAIAMPSVGIVLALCGFGGGAEAVAEGEVSVAGLRWFFVCGPGLLLLGGLLIASRFRITPRSHAVLSAELERLRAGGNADEVEAEVREVCERLSGQPYGVAWKARAASPQD